MVRAKRRRVESYGEYRASVLGESLGHAKIDEKEETALVEEEVLGLRGRGR